MSAAEKPIPVPTDLDRPYWEGALERKLVLQRCNGCGLLSAQPRFVCPRCQSGEFDWSQVSGKGKIHSYSIVWQSTAPGFEDEIPYVICHAQIDEELTCYVTANLVVAEADFGKLNIDLPVIIDFEDRGEAVIPQWRLA
jgi:uncharacterized OB-fold protein